MKKRVDKDGINSEFPFFVCSLLIFFSFSFSFYFNKCIQSKIMIVMQREMSKHISEKNAGISDLMSSCKEISVNRVRKFRIRE